MEKVRGYQGGSIPSRARYQSEPKKRDIDYREAGERRYLWPQHSASTPGLNPSRKILSVDCKENPDDASGTLEDIQKKLVRSHYRRSGFTESEKRFNLEVHKVVEALVKRAEINPSLSRERKDTLYLSEMHVEHFHRDSALLSNVDQTKSSVGSSQRTQEVGWLDWLLSFFCCWHTAQPPRAVPPRLIRPPIYRKHLPDNIDCSLNKLSARSLCNLKKAVQVIITEQENNEIIDEDRLKRLWLLESAIRTNLHLCFFNYQLAKSYYIQLSTIFRYRRAHQKIMWSTLYADMALLRSLHEAITVMNRYDHIDDNDEDLQDAKDSVSRYLYNVFNAFLYPIRTFDIGDIRCLKELCDEHDVTRRGLCKVLALSEELERFERRERGSIGELIDHRLDYPRAQHYGHLTFANGYGSLDEQKGGL